MGASALACYFGVRFRIDSKKELDALERNTDPRLVAARRVGLQVYCDRLTEGEPYFLLIGTELGIFGPQHELEKAIGLESLFPIIEETRRKLHEAHLLGEPTLHLQWIAQY
jgi:hypothetical protein